MLAGAAQICAPSKILAFTQLVSCLLCCSAFFAVSNPSKVLFTYVTQYSEITRVHITTKNKRIG